MNKKTKPPKRGYNKTRGASLRAAHRNQDDAQRIAEQYKQVSIKDTSNKNTLDIKELKISFLGGLSDVGEKNMAIIEYQNEAIILDCGIDLSVDLSGVNYAINNIDYLDTVKHKIKAYVITHGHLDHIGALKHTVPQFPAPIFGSPYTIGIIEKSFENDELQPANFKPELVAIHLESHAQTRIGSFGVEFIRVTHSLPDAAAIAIKTPVGTIVASGDFRLDPEPLDKRPTNTKRLKELGDQDVLLLMSDSSYADAPGRVQTESTLQQSFYDIIDSASGRIFVTSFASNMNRTQMIINAAVADGRKVALDGRGMLMYAEIAVRQGLLKVPRGTIVPIQQAASIKPSDLLVMCTGGQGEPNAALQRMSTGEHRFVNLNAGDTVVVSSSPIPGNEISFDALSNRLCELGVHQFSHPNYQVDGCGPLHVSGHARRDELRELINMIKPKFFIPVHAGMRRRRYHAELAIEEGIPRNNTLLPKNGDSILISSNRFQGRALETIKLAGKVSHGSVLIDQNGAVVDSIVVKDRLLLANDGILTINLTVNKNGTLLTKPSVTSKGFVNVEANTKALDQFGAELNRVVAQRFNRVNQDRFNQELKEFAMHYWFELTGRCPMIIPIVAVVSDSTNRTTKPAQRKSSVSIAQDQQARFQQMREKLLK